MAYRDESCHLWMSHVKYIHEVIFCGVWDMIHICDITHSNVWNTAFTCATYCSHKCDTSYAYVWHDTFACETWLIHMWHDSSLYAMAILIPSSCLRRMGHDSFIPIHNGDMPHLYKWSRHTCDVIHSSVTKRIHVCYDTFQFLRLLRGVWYMTHSHRRRTSFIYVTWLMHMWHDSFIMVTCLIHICDMTYSYVI